ncbi:MAG: DMT family transporter [Cyclobacteriaceae bacterium]|nr:DMT family transporter [Cyclobacteriaceae bacterium HetDA_MAG_MS6]
MLASSKTFRTFTELNLALLIISSSGVLGRSIDLDATLIIWIRCLLGAGFLLMGCVILKSSLRIKRRRDLAMMALAAALLSLHWVTYFYSLQISSVAIGMLSLFTYPVFTAFLEPMFLKTRLSKAHLLLGLITLMGVALLVPVISLDNNITLGVLIGLFSAILYSLRNLMMKVQVADYPGTTVMFYQLAFNVVFLFPTIFFSSWDTVLPQWAPLLFLGLMTTAVGHTLFVRSFSYFTVTTVSILSVVQPVYGIVMGLIFLNEVPGWRAIIGGMLILLTVVIESYRSYR